MIQFIQESLTAEQTICYLYGLRKILPNVAVVLTDTLHEKIRTEISENFKPAVTWSANGRTHHAHLLEGLVDRYLREDFPSLWLRNYHHPIHTLPSSNNHMWFQVDAEYMHAIRRIRRRIIRAYMKVARNASDPNANGENKFTCMYFCSRTDIKGTRGSTANTGVSHTGVLV